MSGANWSDSERPEVQRLVLSCYDVDCSLHLLLELKDVGAARAFIAGLLRGRKVTFGDSQLSDIEEHGAINIGFTYHGLVALGLPDQWLSVLRERTAAFCAGATLRAGRRLGDTAASAAEEWDPMFRADRVDVLISIHGRDHGAVNSIAEELQSRAHAREAFDGWDVARITAAHLPNTTNETRTVHFGFRDPVAMPRIVEPQVQRTRSQHQAGELLLGYPNDEAFNRWGDEVTPEDAEHFYRNGSFGVLRKIEQHEDRFNRYLDEQVERLHSEHWYVTRDYLKAKMCGRWPNGALVLPTDVAEPTGPELSERLSLDFDYRADPHGFGCPFGAHIRRVNPRDDPIAPRRLRPLFRRGMPYGPPHTNGEHPKQERGLVGLFFCASIEDQFEHLVSEWIENKPMGPANPDRSKDPLVGQHDEPGAEFYIPQQAGGRITLKGFAPFVTTRGTLYALFPSRFALDVIARLGGQMQQPATRRFSSIAKLQAGFVRRRPATKMPSQESPASHIAKPALAGVGLPEWTAKTNGELTIDYDSAPADRFCDIVMEGGVTSGIIYASAVVELAKSYRFHSIGGSSIGAFAAAFTAAAEYRRRKGSVEGFQLMAKAPTEIAEEDEQGRTRLQRMFRPQQSTSRLYEILLAMLGRKSMQQRLFRGLIQASNQYRHLSLAIAVLLAAIVLTGPLVSLSTGGLQWPALGSWLSALLMVFGFALIAGPLLGVIFDLRRGLVENNFGLCRGWDEDDSSNSSNLTWYLHAAIQKAAGRHPINDSPLTFKDLWGAPGAPADAFGYASSDNERRSINLEVYATNLAHGRPLRFPIDGADDRGRLFFKIQDLTPYFPKPLLDHLIGHSRPYAPQADSEPAACVATEDCLELPRAELPIAVAARLAMSFPLLISAVPIWAIDYEPPRKQRDLKRCLFSDGGLCLNFPIDMFDRFVPKWPTFGIALQRRSEYRRNQTVWLPKRHSEGRAYAWNDSTDSARSPLGRLGGFVASCAMAAWRWNDMTMMTMPGVRDRVVRVLLEEHEGGINFSMPGSEILTLARCYGKEAAHEFVERFERNGGWAEHRWVRFNRLLIALREQVEGIAFAAGVDRHTLPLEVQIDAALSAAPLLGNSPSRLSPSEQPLNDRQVRELKHLLGTLSTLERMFCHAGDHGPYCAVPRPSLRVRQPI